MTNRELEVLCTEYAAAVSERDESRDALYFNANGDYEKLAAYDELASRASDLRRAIAREVARRLRLDECGYNAIAYGTSPEDLSGPVSRALCREA